MTNQSPEMVEVDSRQVKQMLARASATLSEDDALLMCPIVESYAYITDLVEDKNTSIARLRKLLFGSSTEKAKQLLGDDDADAAPASDAASHGVDGEANNETNNPSPGIEDSDSNHELPFPL